MVFIFLKNYKQIKKEILLIALLCGVYLIGQISLGCNDNLFNNFEYLNNSIFIFLFIIFYNTINLDYIEKQKTLMYYEWIVIINSTAIILGFLFSIKYFTTYHGVRFGYNGFLMKPSYASYFYMVSVFYFMHQVFIIKKKKFALLFLVLIAAILTGTKAAILSIILCGIHVILRAKLYSNNFFLIIVSSIVLTAFLFRKYLSVVLYPKVELFEPIIEEHGIFTALFSFRNLILQDSLIPYIQSQWSFTNYLFGGMGNILIKSGFDLIDLFYFFGIIGSLIYLKIAYKVFYIHKPSKDYYYFILIMVIIMSLGGNLFYNSSVAVLLCIVKLYFELIKERENKNLKYNN
jgi:hypothetical protein